jgi:hypothetical protein
MKPPIAFQVVSDIHGIELDERATEACLAFTESFKPKIRVIAGDLWDFSAIRKGASADEQAQSMAEDYEAGVNFANCFFRGGTQNHLMLGNHCLANGTDVLTDYGWMPVELVTTNDLVAQFDMSTGVVSYQHPIGTVSRHEEQVYSIEGRYTHQVVSAGHDVVLNGVKHKAANLYGQSINESAIRTSASYRARGFTPEDIDEHSSEWLRVLTWVIMDGCIVNLKKYDANTTKARIQFKLSVPRKIEALKALLDKAEIKYTFGLCKKTGVNKLQPYYIRIYGDDARSIISGLDGEKRIPARWALLPRSHFQTVIAAIAETDGAKCYQHTKWTTTDKRNADVMQQWAIHCGCDFSMRAAKPNPKAFPNGKQQWACKFRFDACGDIDQKLKITKMPYNDTVYCVTMPLGTVVTRFGGKVAFTGNCVRIFDLAASKEGVRQDLGARMVADVQALARKNKAKLWPYDSREGVLQIGKLNVVHGYHAGMSACAAHSRIYGNVIFGHVHSIESFQTPGLQQQEARAIGCLCKLDMDYVNRKTGKLRWAHGWAAGYLFEDGTYTLWQIRGVNGRFYAPTGLECF